MECIEAIMIRGQESFQLLNLINTMQITIDDNRIVNLLKKHTKVFYTFMAMGILLEYYFQLQLKMIQNKYL